MGAIKEWLQAARIRTGRFVAGAAGVPADSDDYWYENFASYKTRVNQDTAVSITAIDAGISLISDTIASLPMPIYERIANDERKPWRNHPIWRIVNEQPNSWQTAVDFWANRLVDLQMCGNAFAEIDPRTFGQNEGSRTSGFGALYPLRADRMEVGQADNGDLIYRYSPPNGAKRTINQDLIFHVRNTQTRDNGVTGIGLLDKHVETIGLQLAIQQYSTQLYENGTMHMGVLTHPGQMGDETIRRLRKQWQETYAGSRNAGKPVIVEDGMTFQSTSMTPVDVEVLDSRKFHVEEACRMLRVPPHLLGHTEKNSSWGTGMADLKAGFLEFTLRPILERVEQAVSRDLITQNNRYFPEFNVDGLLRADIKTRYEVYAIGRQWGLLTANEPRRKENLPPITGGDNLLQPTNMLPIGEENTGEFALGRQFIRDAARRHAENERKWLEANLEEMENPAFRSRIQGYFEKRQKTLTKNLYISESDADEYTKYACFTVNEACEQGRLAEMGDEWMQSAERRLTAAIFRQIS